jgi:hypothetical protein
MYVGEFYNGYNNNHIIVDVYVAFHMLGRWNMMSLTNTHVTMVYGSDPKACEGERWAMRKFVQQNVILTYTFWVSYFRGSIHIEASLLGCGFQGVK